jgi:Nucleotidyltransferase of unknown function (DUF6036)
MNQLFKIARQFQDFCDRQGWRSCIIGGIAVNRWGRPRATSDVDLSVLTGFGGEEQVIDTLLAHYAARIPDAKEFAILRRVLLLSSPNGTGIDVSLGALPFEEKVIERSSAFAFNGIELRTCSAEDLMVLKLFASRPGDIRDLEGVAIRNRGKLDWSYIETQLRPLVDLKEEPEILRTLARLRDL